VYVRAVSEPEILVTLESPLPAQLPAGVRTALFCSGTAAIGGRPVSGLELMIDGRPHPVAAFAMPRFDVAPRRSGFWAVVPVSAAQTEVTIAIRLRAEDGRVFERPLGAILVTRPTPEIPTTTETAEATNNARAPGDGLIVVCMATCNPPARLLHAQLESLRTQTDTRWLCVISDDCSDPDSYEQLLAAVGDDARFQVSRSEQRLGFYRNFERALTLVPAAAELIALCDQDDVWHPDKLAVLRRAIGTAGMVYSDMRLVDERGTVLRETLWAGRANNYQSLVSMLIAGSVTGAAMMLTPAIAALSLPFPDSPGIEFHDHWLSLVALAAGRIEYVPRHLYDYVQHPEAVVGKHTGATLTRDLRSAVQIRAWRSAYFLGYVPGQVRAAALLNRCGEKITPARRRELEHYLACDRSPAALLWLLVRPLRALWGRNETLGSEWELARGVIWRLIAGWIARRRRWPARLLPDCRFPDPPLWRQRRLQRWRSRI
jgi:O-antigen biosynthesis protein